MRHYRRGTVFVNYGINKEARRKSRKLSYPKFVMTTIPLGTQLLRRRMFPTSAQTRKR